MGVHFRVKWIFFSYQKIVSVNNHCPLVAKFDYNNS